MDYIKKYQKGSWLNRTIYNSIDPTLDYPDIPQGVMHVKDLILGVGGKKVKKGNEPVSDAAWRKRLGLEYDKKLLLENPDGSFRLPPEYERQILTDTLAVKKRIQDAINIYGSEEELKKYDTDRQNWLRRDRDYLDKLRKMYKGKPVVVNEFEVWKDRKTSPDAISPLNVMKNFTLKYDPKTKRVSYSDIYDFNAFEKLVPGQPFNISGVVPKKQWGGKIGQEFTDFGSRMLHGLQTFGGSYIGDAIQGVSPKAANFVSKYTAGMIAPTPQEYLEKNRSGWGNRLSSAADATSMVLAGEMAGPLVGKAIKKVSPTVSKIFPTKITGYHSSFSPLKTFQKSFPENYFAQRGGTDNAIFFTNKIPPKESFLSQRPYIGEYKIKMKNPYTKDFKTPTEGGTSRWAEVINNAQTKGHDGVIIKGIRDNQIDNSTIYVSLDPKNIKFKKFIKPQVKASVVEEDMLIDPWFAAIEKKYRTNDDLMRVGKEAKAEVIDYLNNPIIRETAERNTALSHRVNYKMPYIIKNGTPRRVNTLQEFREHNIKRPVTLNLDNTPKNTLATYTPGIGENAKITASWQHFGIKNLYPDRKLKGSIEHELLHHSRFGESNIEQLKAEKLFKPRKELLAPESTSAKYSGGIGQDSEPYLLSRGEAAANIRDLGKDLGFSVGLKYPGKTEGMKILNEILPNYKGYKEFVVGDLRLNTPRDYKRVWDALTGKYFLIPSAIAGTTMNKNKE